MSNRTRQAQKAVLAAWENEQALVQEGKGTRDWTPEQQQSILENGKAYDDNGKAFEGQHMKSAEQYPEYQGDPKNIQFLTRDEHFEAHDFNWQNPTNWYFNPDTKIKFDFGDGPYIPCEVIQLSEPVVLSLQTYDVIAEHPDTSSSEAESDITVRREAKESTDTAIPEPILNPQSTTPPKQNPTYIPKTEKVGFWKKIGNGFDKVVKTGVKFASDHPIITALVVAVGGAVIESATSSNRPSNNGNSSNATSRGSNSSYYNNDSSDDIDAYSYEEEPDDTSDETDRSSPVEHTVPAHGQHYHTKEGIIWKEKDPYTRGGKSDDDDDE